VYKRALPAIVLALIGTIISMTLFTHRTLNFQVSLAETVVACIFMLYAIFFFLTSLKTFQPRLKIAYAVLSLGIFLIGAAQAQVSYISFYWLWDSAWVKAGGTVFPYLLSTIALYASMYLFARALHIKAFWAKLRYIIPITIASSVILSFNPNRFPEFQKDSDFAVYMAVLGMAMASGILTFILARHIKKGLGKAYHSAMGWLVIALGIYIFVGIHGALTATFANPAGGYIDYSLWTFDIFGIALLIAAISFNELSRERLSANASFTDVIYYTSQLISDPKEIDVHLDKFRLVTSRLTSDQQLSSQDKKTLVDVYLTIEDYLTTKEPIRKLSRDDIRQRLPESFLSALPS
jgi:hypothetical protein